MCSVERDNHPPRSVGNAVLGAPQHTSSFSCSSCLSPPFAPAWNTHVQPSANPLFCGQSQPAGGVTTAEGTTNKLEQVAARCWVRLVAGSAPSALPVWQHAGGALPWALLLAALARCCCGCRAGAASLPLLLVHPGLEAGELLVPCAEAVRSGRRRRQTWSCRPASAGTEVQWVEDSRVRRSVPQPRSDAPGGQLERACSPVSAGPTGLDAAAAVALEAEPERRLCP